MIEIRQAFLSDVSALKEMFKDLGNYHQKLYPEIIKKDCENRNERELYELIADSQSIYVVADDDDEKVVGFCLATKLKKLESEQVFERSYIMINDLFVIPEYRRKGIGKMFIEYVEKIASKLKYDSVEMNCWAKNEEAMAFYKACGYQPLLVRMTKKPKKNNNRK